MVSKVFNTQKKNTSSDSGIIFFIMKRQGLNDIKYKAFEKLKK